MMINKEQLIKSISSLPDKFSFDDLLDRIILLDKIETGLTQSEKGEINTTEQAKQKLSKWLK
jgi:predicted transcriptional regulator